MANSENFEIERKFLVKMPDVSQIEGKRSEIEQNYLITSEEECNVRRVRKRTTQGKTQYFYTEKVRISDIKRIEREREIEEEEYNTLLKEIDSSYSAIRKTRYVFQYKNQIFELDVFDFSSDLALLEIELQTEETPVEFPSFIELVREVTSEKGYTNYELAKTQSL